LNGIEQRLRDLALSFGEAKKRRTAALLKVRTYFKRAVIFTGTGPCQSIF
jgi:hypothetical protein